MSIYSIQRYVNNRNFFICRFICTLRNHFNYPILFFPSSCFFLKFYFIHLFIHICQFLNLILSHIFTLFHIIFVHETFHLAVYCCVLLSATSMWANIVFLNHNRPCRDASNETQGMTRSVGLPQWFPQFP